MVGLVEEKIKPNLCIANFTDDDDNRFQLYVETDGLFLFIINGNTMFSSNETTVRDLMTLNERKMLLYLIEMWKDLLNERNEDPIVRNLLDRLDTVSFLIDPINNNTMTILVITTVVIIGVFVCKFMSLH
jgi:hypothetical protein